MRLPQRIRTYCFLSLCSAVWAQDALPQRGNAAVDNAASVVRITIDTSRTQPTAGSGLGINATILNTGKNPITLTQQNSVLVVPPELELRPSSGHAYFAFLPSSDPVTIQEEPITPGGYTDFSLTVRPGQSVRTLWTIGSGLTEPASTSAFMSFLMRVYFQFFTEMHFLFFGPGDYVVSVNVKYWDGPKIGVGSYGTAVQTATIHVITPQFVLLFGAAVGGLFAYLVQMRRGFFDPLVVTGMGRVRASLTTIAHFLVGAFAAMLLSAITTILLSRISESQFLIRITISDFWGAIAVGFIAAYSGTAVLSRFLGPAEKDGNVTTQKEPPSPPDHPSQTEPAPHIHDEDDPTAT